MDNLIAERKAQPMLVVMEKGYAQQACRRQRSPPRLNAAPAAPNPGRMFQAFEEVLSKDLIAYIDSNFPNDRRIGITGRWQGFPWAACSPTLIGLNHLDAFSYIGGFSGAGGGFGGGAFDPKTAHNGVMADTDAFNKRVHLLFLSIGTDGTAADAGQRARLP